MFYYKTSLDSADMKLTPLGIKSVFEKTVSLEGAKVTIQIMINKATK